jgi:hypothetical protein
LGLGALSASAQKEIPLAYISTGEYGVEWYPSEDYPAVTLKVSGSNGLVLEGTFNSADSPPYFDFYDDNGNLRPDGNYQYELVAYPILDGETVSILESVSDSEGRAEAVAALREAGKLPDEELSQSGNFSFEGGKVLMGNDHALKTVKGSVSDADEPKVTKDVVHNDDVIVGMSLCVGIDCVNGENFGFDTVRLKENNLRLHFNDTSNTGSFPTNDWRIVANDSANGGASYLAIEDSDAGRIPFRVEAGAPAHSLYVDDGGRLGLKTSTPSVEIHSTDGDTPALRLEQNGGAGFQAQTWDLAGNETNWFLRDVTNGSKLPIRVRPNAPTSSLDVFSNQLVLNDGGNDFDVRIEGDTDQNLFYADASVERIGIGTSTPGAKFHVFGTSSGRAAEFEQNNGFANTEIRLNAPTTGSNWGLTAGAGSGGFTITETGVATRLKVAEGGNVGIANSAPNALLQVNLATCNGLSWINSSSRDTKKEIEPLSEEEIKGLIEVLDDVKIVQYLYREESSDASPRIGLIAEDMPDILATEDHKGMDLGRHVGFLMGVVKAMRAERVEMAREIDYLKSAIESLESQK